VPSTSLTVSLLQAFSSLKLFFLEFIEHATHFDKLRRLRKLAEIMQYLLTSFLALVWYCIYVAYWRLYLSPIAHIPGPRLAALTLWLFSAQDSITEMISDGD
jgi:hypothetical protein